MKPEIIKVVFTNILFVIGVILVIVGFTKGVLTISRLLVFDKYPLQTHEESRCELDTLSPYPVKEGNVSELSKQELQERKTNCLASLELQRKVRMVEDITTSLSTFVAGFVLVFVFRRNILK